MALTKHRPKSMHPALHLSTPLRFYFPSMQKHPMIYYNLSQSKTHNLNFLFGFPAHTDKFLKLFHSTGPLDWLSGIVPELRLGRLKQDVNDLRCSFITKHFLGFTTLPLPVSLSLSPTSVISEKKGGKSLGTNGEERIASGCNHH